jgi:hypothetical protein
VPRNEDRGLRRHTGLVEIADPQADFILGRLLSLVSNRQLDGLGRLAQPWRAFDEQPPDALPVLGPESPKEESLDDLAQPILGLLAETRSVLEGGCGASKTARVARVTTKFARPIAVGQHQRERRPGAYQILVKARLPIRTELPSGPARLCGRPHTPPMGTSAIISARVMGRGPERSGSGGGLEMTATFRALLGWLGGGSALATLVSVLLAVGALVLGLIYRRYLGVLGADRRKPAERQAYDALRASLAEGNLAARLYAERLTRFLNWIDQFFGDAGVADRTLFPRAFRLKVPAHLWTAPAFDRCLFLALLYPITSIFTIWAVSGHAGLAEAALHLRPAPSGWERALVMLLAAGCAFAMFRRRPVAEVTGWRSLLSFIIFVMLVALLVAGGVAKLDPIVVPVVLLGAVVAPDAVARNGAAVFAFGFAFAVFGAFVGNAAEIIVLTGFAAGILTLSSAAAVAVLSNLAAR